MSESKLAYKRVILKLSGESLADASGRGISGEESSEIAAEIKKAHESGCQIAIVNGGGNILRGAQFSDGNSMVQEATAHYMGMICLLYTSPSPRDRQKSRMPSSA